MSPVASSPEVIAVPALAFRAAIAASSVNDEARTVDVVFSTGAPVMRYDWASGERYIEKLSMEPDAIRLDRLNAGGPVLNSHNGYSLQSVLGVVADGSASSNGKRATATLQFSKREDVAPFWQDIKDRVIRNVSVGYVVHAYQETPGKNGAPKTRLATDWEPYEISMVPMPADPGSQTRDGKAALETFPCRITRAAATSEETAMEPTQSDTIVERDPLDPGAPTGTRAAASAPPTEPTDADLATRAERDRVQGIMQACRIARMTPEFQDKLIADSTSLVEAQRMVFEEMRKRGGEQAGPSGVQARTVRVGDDDPLLHTRAGIEEALLHRVAGDLRKADGTPHFPLTDKGRKYRGMSMLDTARVCLQARGIRVTDLSRKELAGMALGLDMRGGGLHSTSDFANILADVANKTLRAAYEEQPQTFRPLVRVVSIADFKTVNRVQLGDAPALLEIGEDGEFKSGTISDGKESYGLTTYGRKFGITRKALINDDVDAFSRVPMMFGRKARVLESNLVWAQITGNPTMGDNNALFSAAHNNLETDGDHISVDSLGRARTSLRQQTSLDGDYLNLTAQYLIVPTALETIADQFVTVITPQQAGNVNPFQQKLQVIAEPRLDADSTTAWYLAASVANVDIIELAYLEGEEGPMVDSRVGFDIDGLEIRCRLDVAAKVIDWRGLHKDPGDLNS